MADWSEHPPGTKYRVWVEVEAELPDGSYEEGPYFGVDPHLAGSFGSLAEATWLQDELGYFDRGDESEVGDRDECALSACHNITCRRII